MPKLVKNEKHLSRVFNLIKITESLGIMFFVYLAGYIRQTTDSFTGVTFMMLCCAFIALLANVALISETKAVGASLMSLRDIQDNV